MLSRVAENLYWMSRNIERAENLARLLGVGFDLELDAAGLARIRDAFAAAARRAARLGIDAIEVHAA